MPRGVYYNIQIKETPSLVHIYDKMTMKESIETIKTDLLKFHDIDTKLSNEVIYNLIKRPHTVNKMVRHFVSVSKFSEMV
tara:strand:- start:193 stop:432 length:240 start_codon:yes stop_codon:yes gene_type:complete